MPLEIQKSRATTQMAWRASAPIAATGTDVHAFFFCLIVKSTRECQSNGGIVQRV